MSSANEHLDWLKLVEVSGPFLSLGVLVEELPQGLDADDAQIVSLLRSAHDEWRDATCGSRPDIAIHRAFVDLVISDVLGYRDSDRHRDAEITRIVLDLPGGGRERPDALIGESGTAGRRLLLSVAPPGERLDRPSADVGSALSAEERVRQLCIASGVASALVTNGRHWTYVHAPLGRTATYARFDLEVMRDERVALRAFRTLLGRARLLGAMDNRTLDALLERSKDDERDVTTRLGRQTRRAVEMLVAALDQDDRNHDGDLSEAIRRSAADRTVEEVLYEAAVATVMRLVFLLAAEDRGLLPEDAPWLEGYAVHPMLPLLRATDEELLERRYDAWGRLLATFSAIHGGIAHDAVRLPGYGGDLFDPLRWPLLAHGTRRRPVRVSNLVVFRVLRELLELEVDVPGGGKQRRPLSYRALGVEQIGHVYEGLLDHTARRATELVLGLAGTKEPEVAVSELTILRERGDEALIAGLKELTGRTPAALRNALGRAPTVETIERASRELGHDAALLEAARHWLGLLPESSDRPALIRPGQAFVTASNARRSTGTHYTPRSLTEPIVKHALDPLCFDGCAEGEPEAAWRLRPVEHLLGLKIADIAMGSGAFLVQACRYLGERVAEAWRADRAARPAGIGDDPDEMLVAAKRRAAERCLYGVDRNSLAVEMAKLSLWLETLQRGRPFTFVDHALRCGDSLVGVASLRQLEGLSLSRHVRHTLLNAQALAVIHDRVEDARAARDLLEETDDSDLAAVDAKASILRAASEETAQLRRVADVICGTAIQASSGMSAPNAEHLMDEYAPAIAALLTGTDSDRDLTGGVRLLELARSPGDGVVPRPFHWPLEYPEVFIRPDGGFDAVIGNPPFLGGKKITGALGRAYREHLVEIVGNGVRGNSDLCAYFFLRAANLTNAEGTLGLVATNTIAQGDTRVTGLDQLHGQGWGIYRGVKSEAWPGDASLHVAFVWAGRSMEPTLSTSLDKRSRVAGLPLPLVPVGVSSFQGSIPLGEGFVLTSEEAAELLRGDPRNGAVVREYINGEDFMTRPDMGPSRWIIDFWTRSEDEARQYADPWKIVEERVRPVRRRRRPDGTFQLRNPLPLRWWQYADKRPALYEAIAGRDRVLVGPSVAKWWAVAWLQSGIVYSSSLNVFALFDDASAAVMSSTWHDAWARKWSGSLETRLSYSPTDCFQNFPFPLDISSLESIGAAYLEHRKGTQIRRGEGLTAVYNRAYEQNDAGDADIARLRDLRVALDRAVADAYGWSDLELDHDHRTVDLLGHRSVRFTISDAIRLEALDRLLELNHSRYAEQVAEGLGGARPGQSKTTRHKPEVRALPDQDTLGF